MEKIQNRNKYLKNFTEFCRKVDLNEEFLKELREHKFFSDHIKNIEGLTQEEKKVFILLELTRERKSCASIIELLRESNQEEVAKELELYNTSPGLMNINDLDTKTKIPVTVANIPKESSLCYHMNSNPRGKCLIINNADFFYKETQRFKHIFKELYFDVKAAYHRSVQQIEKMLKDLSIIESLEKDDALIVMFIAHGNDEQILGFSHDSSKKELMKISDVIDIFSSENCKKLDKKPKIFIFDCCRGKDPSEIPAVDITSITTGKQKRIKLSKDLRTEFQTDHKNEKFSLKLNFASNEWVNQNSNTFIIYSCSEGHLSHSLKTNNIEDGISAFGQVFSHAIARYACEESLQSIMSRTCEAMEQFRDKGHYSAPELRTHCATRDFYFNAGHHI